MTHSEPAQGGSCPSIYDLLIETPYLRPRGAPALLPAAAGPGLVIAPDKTVRVSLRHSALVRAARAAAAVSTQTTRPSCRGHVGV